MMQTMRLGQYVVAAFTVSMMVLMAGMVGLRVAIQQGAVAPMPLDMQLGQARLVAHVTYWPECPPYATFCPRETPGREFYAIWVYQPAEWTDLPGLIYERGTRILTLPLQKSWVS
jgi:hypothetical protein